MSCGYTSHASVEAQLADGEVSLRLDRVGDPMDAIAPVTRFPLLVGFWPSTNEHLNRPPLSSVCSGARSVGTIAGLCLVEVKMTVSRMKRLVAVAGCLTLAVPPMAMAAFDADQLKCHETISALGAKVAGQALKSITSCHAKRRTGKLARSLDCNQVVQSDPDGRVEVLASELASQATDRCAASRPSALNYPACPSLCSSEVPVIATFDDVAACIACVLEKASEDMGRSSLGAPLTPLPTLEARCHSAIATTQLRLFKAALNESRKCQKAAEASGTMSVSQCSGSDPQGKLDRVRGRNAAAVAGACGAFGIDLFAVDSCNKVEATLLARCVRNGTEHFADLAFRSLYELDTDHVTTTTTGPTSTTTNTTVSTTTTTLPVCSVTFGVTTSESLGALQYEVNYAAANGEFVGEGFAVSCLSLVTAAAATFSDNDLGRVLGTAIIREAAFVGPVDVARCSFATNDQTISAAKFGTTLIDATTPDFLPVTPTVAITSINCPFN